MIQPELLYSGDINVVTQIASGSDEIVYNYYHVPALGVMIMIMLTLPPIMLVIKELTRKWRE